MAGLDASAGAADLDGSNYLELALGNTTRIQMHSDRSKCLSVADSVDVHDGTGVVVQQCDDNSDNQKWMFDVGTNQIRSKRSSRYCIRKVPGAGSASSGDPIDLYSCAGCTSCEWLLAPTGSQHVFLALSALSLAEGVDATAVRLAVCPSHALASCAPDAYR